MSIKPIETYYNGYRFRSRLEARWAVFFDSLGIKYEYEPEGYRLSDGSMYLPDFYLVEQKDFFEVKGVMSDFDIKKIRQFVLDQKHQIFIGYSDFSFEVIDSYYFNGVRFAQSKSECVVAQCMNCGKFYFLDMWGSYRCRICNHYNGDHTFCDFQRGDWIDGKYTTTCEEVIQAIANAKQARFEHGETPLKEATA